MSTLVEAQIEQVVKDSLNQSVSRVFRTVKWLAARQGGRSFIENYQLLGKRALIVFGTAFVTFNVVVGVSSRIIARRNEEIRMRKIVQRVLEEEGLSKDSSSEKDKA